MAVSKAVRQNLGTCSLPPPPDPQYHTHTAGHLAEDLGMRLGSGRDGHIGLGTMLHMHMLGLQVWPSGDVNASYLHSRIQVQV